MLITLEGIEGSGKSSVVGELKQWLEGRGVEVCLTREPGGSPLGRQLRAILLDVANSDLAPEAELFLYLADRAQHVRQIIMPALKAGKFVICDRYADSTIAYQGYGRGGDVDKLIMLNNIALGGLWPDVTLLFDLDASVGLGRARARNKAENIEESEGRFEAEELSFHEKIRAGYLDLAKKYSSRYLIVDAGRELSDVIEQAKHSLALKLGI